MSSRGHEVAMRLWLGGQVQGVGYRPFVYRLAQRLQLKGWVRNRSGQVEIEADGDAVALEQFQWALVHEAPSLAKPRIVSCEEIPPFDSPTFAILDSEESTHADVHVPPDYYACDDCLRELRDPNDRRYRYPFINCTQCGPRYTLIERLPYDRPHTSMAAFPLCADCRREYNDASDRRFHAEPLACPVCGPQLMFVQGDAVVDDSTKALAACVAALKAGQVVAVKGIGGYHLMCDATHSAAVARIRVHKPRPAKPLAVMFPVDDDLAALRRAVELDTESECRLRDVMRPIVLVRRRRNGGLCEEIAPGLDDIGVILPYSPLHHLLLGDVGVPLVATSANISGEPVLIDQADVAARLRHVADACLHHNRPIVRPADDPVLQVVAGRARMLRLGRGNAPLEWELPHAIERPVLAVGGHAKNTVGIAWDRRVVISPHIGELNSPRSLEVFHRTLADLQRLYGVHAEHVAYDAHPAYASTRWAEQCGLSLTKVFHHHAHASALAGEYPDVERWLVFTWDGTGYGEDGTIWGGEALLGAPGSWRRVATMRPFRLPGGERAAHEPWRSACALAWETGSEWDAAPAGADVLRHAWQRRLNAPTTSAVGRLFDGAAAMLGLTQMASFEAQAPMMLETAARTAWPAKPVSMAIEKNARQLWEADWSALLPMLQDAGMSIGARAAAFHASLATTLLDITRHVQAEHGPFAVGLTGGVFQNRLLAEHALAELGDAGFDAYLPASIPPNDAGISFGQLIEATRTTT
ncbi:MAG TPA: carbamoyltransferase HypF [Dyella sp.]|uniref:carbamoyltransferase HypF n=1 Tax=Dyella sp. TaxID=1869338 RepID=UPI002BA511E4|nr:carbamoyltransferase HypF [Dyella sp.]HUB88394.1 carbamoyltransferase HypF [Dyella sp.]